MDVKAFPEEWELSGFFGVEPELLDADAPWIYNVITYRREKGGETLCCSFAPAYGDLDLTLTCGQVQKLRLSLHQIQRVDLVHEHGRERLRLAFNEQTPLNDFWLTLKPEMCIVWGNTPD